MPVASAALASPTPSPRALRALDAARTARLLAWDQLHAALARHRRRPGAPSRADVRQAVCAYRAAFARHREANAALDGAA